MLPLSAPTGDVAQVDLTITAIPVTLESVQTVAATSCPRRSDASAALALLDQARSALLTTIVSRGVKPAGMKRLFFDRRMDGNSNRITHQRVRVDSAVTAGSFVALRSASHFVMHGFMLDSAGIRTFFAPDAETLVDDGFAGGYCFRIIDAERSRPHQIGLGFRAADGRRDRVDIDGALWIDTLARALIDVEFSYVGLDRAYEPYHPGGRVSFQAMPNGVVLVDRWTLRFADEREDTVIMLLRRPQLKGGATARCPTNLCSNRVGLPKRDMREVGGELARVVWDDGSSWKGQLGRLVVHAVRDAAQSEMRTVMKLDDTEYLGVSDAGGALVIEDLMPGPYDLVVVDPDLSPLGITLPTGTSFAAMRDSTLSVRVTVPSAAAYVAQACGASADQGSSGTAWILGRVTTPAGRPLPGATWVVQRSVDGGGWVDIASGGSTDANGIFHYCRLALGTAVRVAARHAGAEEVSHVQALAQRLTIFTLEITPR